MAEMYKLRVWMHLHCTDREIWIYRDVMVPAIPRLLPGDKEDRCDFSMTGLFADELYVRGLDRNTYVKGQPEEPLYEPCYDAGEGTWHVRATDHKPSHTWAKAKVGPYRDWTATDRVRVVATGAEANAAAKTGPDEAPPTVDRKGRKKPATGIV